MTSFAKLHCINFDSLISFCDDNNLRKRQGYPKLKRNQKITMLLLKKVLLFCLNAGIRFKKLGENGHL